MKRFIVLAIAAILTFAAVAPAHADGYRHYNGYKNKQEEEAAAVGAIFLIGLLAAMQAQQQVVTNPYPQPVYPTQPPVYQPAPVYQAAPIYQQPVAVPQNCRKVGYGKDGSVLLSCR